MIIMPEPFKYRALTIYHYHDGAIVFTFCPWSDNTGAQEIFAMDVAIWSTDSTLHAEDRIYLTNKYGKINESEVDWATVDRQ